jgi:hypothetical protein
VHVGSERRNQRSAETYQGAGSSEPRIGLSAGAAAASGLPRLGARGHRQHRQGAVCKRRGRASCGAQSYCGECQQLLGSFVNESFEVSDPLMKNGWPSCELFVRRTNEECCLVNCVACCSVPAHECPKRKHTAS